MVDHDHYFPKKQTSYEIAIVVGYVCMYVCVYVYKYIDRYVYIYMPCSSLRQMADVCVFIQYPWFIYVPLKHVAYLKMNS